MYIIDLEFISLFFFDKRKRVWFLIFLEILIVGKSLKKYLIVDCVIVSLFVFNLFLIVWICCNIFINVVEDIWWEVFSFLKRGIKFKYLFGKVIKYGFILYFLFNWSVNCL